MDTLTEEKNVTETLDAQAEAPAAQEKTKEEKRKENLIEWIKDIAVAMAVTFLILQFIQPTIVREHSMESTLQEGDYLFVSKQQYKLFGKDHSRGDIIVFRSELTTAAGAKKLLIKRIIGVPGDTVAIHGGTVYINGSAIEEDYTRDGYTDSEMEEITVPDGKLFVMGDNRQNSADSRDGRVGMVDTEQVMGKAVFRLFPLKQIGKI